MARCRASAGPPSEAARHEIRKAAKDARYTAEAASLAGLRRSRRAVRHMKKLQSVLGDQHDAVVARGAARDIGVRAYQAGENAFAFGILHERCRYDALVQAELARAQLAAMFGSGACRT